MRASEKIICTCEQCGFIFKNRIKQRKGIVQKFCSTKCMGEYNNTSVLVSCVLCEKEFKKTKNQAKKHPNHFCSRSCAATYNNKHKTKGTRVSKLELWLQSKLQEQYPSLDFHFNQKNTINSELDIYIPSLKLAFEVNGVFHYKPVFGEAKFHKIQKNDLDKQIKSKEKNINLHIINISSQKRFKETTSFVFLNTISSIINGSPT